MARIGWNNIAPIAVNDDFAQMANQSFTRGLDTLTGAVRGFATDTRNQNTNDLIKEAMGINALADIEEGRKGVLASLAGYGNGADSIRVMEALDKQENALYTKQNTLNQLAQHDRNLVREQGQDADRTRMKNADMIKKAMAGDPAALAYMQQMFDGSQLLNMYTAGVKGKKDDARYNQDRNDRLTQQAFTNNLATENANIQLSQYVNPNAGQEYTTYKENDDGSTTEEIRIMPTAAETLAGISRGRGRGGAMDWGSISQGAASTGGNQGAVGKAANPTHDTVTSNLRSLAQNMRGEVGLAVTRNNITDPRTLAMIAIESGGGGMSTNSGSSVGPMQLNAKYAKETAKRFGIKGDPLTNLDANIQTGVAIMNDLNKKFNGNSDAVAIAYNGGENAGKVAYNAWLNAGKRGRVADYIPSTYTSNGKTYSYDVKQMRDHAYKFENAVGRLETQFGSKPQQASQTIPNTIARPAAPKANGGNYSLGSGALAAAQRGYASAVNANQQEYKASTRKGGSSESQKNLARMNLEDNGIKPDGGLLASLTSDNQNVYDSLKKNPTFNKLNASDQKSVLDDALKYNKNNQGWIFGRNPSDDLINNRANVRMQSLLENKVVSYTEKDFKALRTSAEKAVEAESKRKGRTGKIPTVDQMMNLIDPTMYNKLKKANNQTNNPF